MSSWVVFFGVGLITLIMFSLIIRLYFMVRNLNASFAKLGYIVREDAKKYFDEASEKIVNTNESLQLSYSKIVHDGTISALADASIVMEQSLSKANKESGDIILKAREDSQHIISAARTDASTYVEQTLGQSADTIQWVMEQYTKETFDINQHQELIKKKLDEYINEHRA